MLRLFLDCYLYGCPVSSSRRLLHGAGFERYPKRTAQQSFLGKDCSTALFRSFHVCASECHVSDSQPASQPDSQPDSQPPSHAEIQFGPHHLAHTRNLNLRGWDPADKLHPFLQFSFIPVVKDLVPYSIFA